ncbi:MAG: hypothetical protein H0T89_27745 [Deltaproteobacteria bacterium]|nr:hypothetical protein [Deltaproteobacteria bacterium]MDQ3296668.1 hypothetical protein [Myxococcota bacterium]
MLRIAGIAGIGALALVGGVADAHADVRGVVRFGVLPLDLESSDDTPVFGDDVDRAVTAYNTAAAAYDRRHGGTTTMIDAGDLGVSDTLVTFAPGLETGGDLLFFRVEALVGIGDELRTAGVGIYPLNVQTPLGRDLAAYLSVGGSASWLDREGSGDVGGLVSLRAAGGVRIAERVVIEAGYGAFVLGGVVDRSELDGIEPTADTPLPEPNAVVAAGEARGIVDLSVGVVF